MKYWMLFTLRMIARIGLAAVVLLWIAGQGGTVSMGTTVGSTFVAASTDETTFGFAWMPPNWSQHLGVEGYIGSIQYLMPGTFMEGATVIRSSHAPVDYCFDFSFGFGRVQASHWVLFTTFLVVTVATSWRRKRPKTPPAESSAASEP